MAAQEIHNWGKDIWSNPAVIVTPESVEEIRAIMRDRERYPAPVRAVGSNHSTTHCAVAEGGTVVRMSKLDRILDIGEDSVTAEAGALYIDVALALEKQGKQLFVNVELGNLTMGSACTGGTKDASMPGEVGQVCSYADVIKMVSPSGELIEFNTSDPQALQYARSSYGLFGIVYEVTFRVQKLRPMRVYHETYALERFLERLPELTARKQSMMLYLFPHEDKITVEYRSTRPSGSNPPRHAGPSASASTVSASRSSTTTPSNACSTATSASASLPPSPPNPRGASRHPPSMPHEPGPYYAPKRPSAARFRAHVWKPWTTPGIC